MPNNARKLSVPEDTVGAKTAELRLYWERSLDALFVSDQFGRYVKVNPAACTMTGYSAEELLGMGVPDLATTDECSHFERLIAHKESTGRVQMRRKDGTVLTTDIHAVALGNGHYLAMVRDVSQEQRIEDMLRQSEQYNSLIINGITDLVILFEVTPNEEFRFVKGSSSFLKRANIGEEQVTGKLLQEVCPGQAVLMSDNIRKAISLKQPITSEERTPLGFFRTKIIPVFDPPGTCTHVIVVAQDVSEKREAEEKIIFQANLLEQVRNSIIVIDNQAGITYWNKYSEVLYEWTVEEAMGRKITDLLVAEAQKPAAEKLLNSVFEKGFWEGEVRNQTKTGRHLFLHTTLTLMKNSLNEPTGIVGIFSDITERKELDIQMARLDRLNIIGEMAAGIGHEVRNPLTTIRGFLQLLSVKGRYAGDKEHFTLMISEIDRASSIISEYLSLARNRVIHRKLQNLNTIILNLIPLLQADAAVADKEIIGELSEIPDLFIDEREIRQLLLNLVRNGLEASPKGSSLSIRTHVDNQDIVLSIQDWGPGIPLDILEKVGTPFFSTKENGTGLGLAVCYSIAARHNAAITIKTGTSGTTFCIRFKERFPRQALTQSGVKDKADDESGYYKRTDRSK